MILRLNPPQQDKGLEFCPLLESSYDPYMETGFPLCVHLKGGSSGPSTVTHTGEVDKEYNRRMAAIAEAQQDMAEEMMGYYRKYSLPYERTQIKSLERLLPYQEQYERGALESAAALQPIQTEAERAALQSQIGLQPLQTQAQREALKSQIGLQPIQTEAERAALQSQLELQPIQTQAQRGALESQIELQPYSTTAQRGALSTEADLYNAMQQAGLPQQAVDVRSQFLKEATEGIDIASRMGQAQGDVSAGFQGARQNQRLADARMGLRPDSGASMARSQDLAVKQAGQIAGARTRARTRAEEENFQRLSQAAGLGYGV